MHHRSDCGRAVESFRAGAVKLFPDGAGEYRQPDYGFFNELSDYLENFQHYRITVGVSSEVESFEQISTAIEMSKEAAASRLFKGNGRRIEYCQEPHTLFSPKDFQNEYEEFAKAVETMQPDACQYQIHKCFRLASDKALLQANFMQWDCGCSAVLMTFWK